MAPVWKGENQPPLQFFRKLCDALLPVSMQVPDDDRGEQVLRVAVLASARGLLRAQHAVDGLPKRETGGASSDGDGSEAHRHVVFPPCGDVAVQHDVTLRVEEKTVEAAVCVVFVDTENFQGCGGVMAADGVVSHFDCVVWLGDGEAAGEEADWVPPLCPLLAGSRACAMVGHEAALGDVLVASFPPLAGEQSVCFHNPPSQLHLLPAAPHPAGWSVGVVGPSWCGKRSLAHRLTQGSLKSTLVTGVEYFVGLNCRLHVSGVRCIHGRAPHVWIVCFPLDDTNNRAEAALAKCFEVLESMRQPGQLVCLVGTKHDRRTVTQGAQGAALAERFGAHVYLESSALTGFGLDMLGKVLDRFFTAVTLSGQSDGPQPSAPPLDQPSAPPLDQLAVGPTPGFVLHDSPTGNDGPRQYTGVAPPPPPIVVGGTADEQWDSYKSERQQAIESKGAIARFWKGSILGTEDSLRRANRESCASRWAKQFPALCATEQYRYHIRCKYVNGTSTLLHGVVYLTTKQILFVPLASGLYHSFKQPFESVVSYQVFDGGVLIFTRLEVLQFQEFNSGVSSTLGRMWGTVQEADCDVFVGHFDRLWREALGC
eukprot:TRINITY_DN524_c0_g4_i1.p1 TRINITY_DN524_c0_g4~~TRINITY_DN524_c0_g4_i1.p1  ORF type:complete len:644 (+),score=78.49 TRINITY_DN524_c0_g4_i1:144-1934(+)